MVEESRQDIKLTGDDAVVKRAYVSPKLQEYGRLTDLTQGTYTYGLKDQNAGSYYPTFFSPKE
ncbi:MAG: lasso RiPP family leader peptide-containing protein [Anaerolineae bacterium]